MIYLNVHFQAGLAIEIGINMPSNVKVTKEVSEYFEELASKAELLSIVNEIIL